MNDFQPLARMRVSKRTALRCLIGGVFATTLGFSAAASAETRKVQRGETTIEYLVDGRGPTVLMIASLGRPAEDFDDLSARLVATGLKNAEVAARLGLSARTITSHLDHIYARLGITSRAALTRHIIETGQLSPAAATPPRGRRR